MQVFFTLCQLFVIFFFGLTIVLNICGQQEKIYEINHWIATHKMLDYLVSVLFWMGIYSAIFSILL